MFGEPYDNILYIGNSHIQYGIKDDNTIQLYSLYVPHENRGHHMGYLLINLVIIIVKLLGYNKLILQVYPFADEPLNKKQLLQYYKNFGFKEIKRIDNVKTMRLKLC